MSELNIIKSILDKELIEKIPALSDRLAQASVDRLSLLLNSISKNEWRILDYSQIDSIQATVLGSESSIYINNSGQIVFDKDIRDKLLAQGATPGDEIIKFQGIPCSVDWSLSIVFSQEEQTNPANSYTFELVNNNKTNTIPFNSFLPIIFSGTGNIYTQIRFDPNTNGKVIIQGIIVLYLLR